MPCWAQAEDLVGPAGSRCSQGGAQEAVYSQVETDIARFKVTDKDFELLQGLLEKNSNDCYAHFLLGRCFQRKGMMDLADEQLDLVHKLESRPEDILRRLRHHIEAGELFEAFTMSPMLLEKTPDDPTVVLLRAIFMQTNGLTYNSESLLGTLLKRNDCPLGAATCLATIRIDQHKYSEALELADRDLKINKSYMAARMAKAQALMAMGKLYPAIALLKEPLAEHPFNRKLNMMMYNAYGRIGATDDELRCAFRILACSDSISYYEESQDRVKRLLQTMPSSRYRPILAEVTPLIDQTNYAMKFHFFLGQVFFRMRRGAEAREQIQIAMNMDPVFQPNWYEMARIKEVYYSDFKGAVDDFRKAHQLQRSDYKASLAIFRATDRRDNQSRDLADKLKRLLRRPT